MRHALLPLVGEPRTGDQGAAEGPLWRLEGERLVAQGKPASLSNGLAWSPDGPTMYHRHTMTGEINAWDYNLKTGAMSRGRLFAHVEGAPGPDGAEVDSDGFYWSAINGQGRILRFDPSGRWTIADKDAAQYPLDGNIFAFEVPVPGLPTSRWVG